MAINEKDGYEYIGKNKLVIPRGQRWPHRPYVYFDLTGSGVILEDNVALSSGIRIYTHTHQFNKSNWRDLKIIKSKQDTILKALCFIGSNVIILHSCKYIGISSVVGTGSVITKDIPDYEIWAGNPAKKIGDVEH